MGCVWVIGQAHGIITGVRVSISYKRIKSTVMEGVKYTNGKI